MQVPPEQTPNPASPNAQLRAVVPHNLEFKAAILLIFLVALIAGSVAYLMYARGAFEATQELVLLADDSDGVSVGMDLTFSGFPVGRINRIELGKDGKARILVAIASKDAHWLRSSSIFTMERGIVGSPRIRAFTGVPTDPPLEAGAERTLLVGDVAAEIPLLVSAAKQLIDNVNNLTSAESALNASLTNLQGLTDKLNGKHGALGALVGNDKDAQKILQTLDRANDVLAKVDGLLVKTDKQVFGKDGDSQATIVQLNAMLGEARTSLKKIDTVLADAQVISGNAKAASGDLGSLRADVDRSLRKVEQLVNEINRKWPFARDTELNLP
ncbi:mammalian cell entry protein [Herminiimonas sp. KBW02]|uniref:MlaD family protein n=1 Tax=Herminiimonas sp. KBW02 TaxID=2153363 RepID=UPI000F5B640C|nr:MlaD family protein [Herminiimonas sp. KBW02]RQO38517.1 mammalian cell entry protein [Herminiimonas sp. KBW02]